MNLTKEAEYAILFCMYLSRAGRATVGAAAENLHLSKSFLEQVSRKLRLSSMITSVRGPGGGYELISKEVTVYDLLNALGIDFNFIPAEGQDRLRRGPTESRSLAIYAKWYSMNSYHMLDMKLTGLVQNSVNQELTLLDAASDKVVQ